MKFVKLTLIALVTYCASVAFAYQGQPKKLLIFQSLENIESVYLDEVSVEESIITSDELDTVCSLQPLNEISLPFKGVIYILKRVELKMYSPICIGISDSSRVRSSILYFEAQNHESYGLTLKPDNSRRGWTISLFKNGSDLRHYYYPAVTEFY